MLSRCCSVKYRFASSHFNRGEFSSSPSYPATEPDWRLEALPRGLEDERRRGSPALWRVFWTTISRSDCSRSIGGRGSGSTGSCGMDVDVERFLRMPDQCQNGYCDSMTVA